MANKYYEYLEKLRQSGKINMMGAAQYLQDEFNLSKVEARKILMDWFKLNK